jgi:uncharacterized protein involved in copper resistance
MKTLTRTLACLLVAGGACGLAGFGCAKEEKAATKKAEPTMTPATMAAAPAMKEADMTHTVMGDCPMFATMPMDASAKPMGACKAGEKVVVLMPRGKYSQVATMSGAKGFVPTQSLKPIGN